MVRSDGVEHPIDALESCGQALFLCKGFPKLNDVVNGSYYALNVVGQLGQELGREIELRFAHLHQILQGGLNVSICDRPMVSVDPVQHEFDILQHVFMSFLITDDGLHLALEAGQLCRFLTVSKILLGFSQEETIRWAVYFLLSLCPAALEADK
jgi:hypothetical protein